jgi:hypothetical protein
MSSSSSSSSEATEKHLVEENPLFEITPEELHVYKYCDFSISISDFCAFHIFANSNGDHDLCRTGLLFLYKSATRIIKEIQKNLCVWEI